MDQNAKTQAIEQIKKAQNVLVTVSENPSVDQLAAAIGFTLLLNKLNKHATAVFSGQIPSTIEFLKPEETLEGNTDSLRDFIISLDKNKADKLRYKVEDDVVRIYVTPYRTSISDQDLTFSQGDFNVDVVIALGVYNQDQLDKAIQDHGRILHDAAIISVIAGGDGADIGGINWSDQNASSLCEMLMGISESLKSGVIDEQIATALLTGIVAETDRFSNEKTTPKAMTMSAQLMSAGANQQLISESLKPEPEPEPEQPEDEQKPDYEEESGPSLADIQAEQTQEETEEDGVLNLHHEHDNQSQAQPDEPQEVEDHHIGIDDEGKFANAEQLREQVEDVQSGGSFKGKTIEPPVDYEPGGQLPSLDGSPSYTPGVVTNAPISATDDGNGPADNSQWHLPQVDWAGQDGGGQAPPQDGGQSDEYQQYADNLQLPPQPQDTPPQGAPQAPPVVPMSQGEPYIKPDDIPKQHGEDTLSDEEAARLVKQREESDGEVPEIKPEHSKREFLDHPPSTDPGDEDHDADEEKPAIEQAQPRYSKYLNEPPKDEPQLNALDGAAQEQTVDPLAETRESAAIKEAKQGKPQEDPWLSTQHDAESPRAKEVPETRHPRLYDDGVGVSKNKRLGAPVSDYNTLDEIEESVKEVAGEVHHSSGSEQNARDAVKDALAGATQDNPFDYLELDSDPAKNGQDQAPAPPSIPVDQSNDEPPAAPPPLMPPGMPS